MRNDGAMPLYRKVKTWILTHIESGEWPEGSRIPSENEMVSVLGVSRMTANRAVRELSSEGRLKRIQGVGTFVALATAQSEIVTLRNIADEVRERGHEHSCTVVQLGSQDADAATAAKLGLSPGQQVFHSILVHCENGTPIQLEDRLVNPRVAAAYLENDFTRVTPNAWLMKAAPLDRVEHTIEAVPGDPDTARLLHIDGDEPCLVVLRKTWSGGHVASWARLVHPGTRFRLYAEFDYHQSALAGRLRRQSHPEVTS